MNILMFGWEFPPYISGGMGMACAGLTRGLNEVGGVRTTFVLPKLGEHCSRPTLTIAAGIPFGSPPNDPCDEGFVDSIRFVEIDTFLPAYSTKPATLSKFAKESASSIKRAQHSSYSGNSLTHEAVRYASSAAHLLSEIDKIDVIHAHDWLTYLAGAHAKKITGKPLVVHVHSTEFDRSGDDHNQEIFRIERFGMDVADRIVAVSNYTRDVIIERYSQCPSKVVTIYNAAEKYLVERPPKTDNMPQFVVTFLGRITFQKGPEYFVEAARLVLRKIKNVRFVMAGDGDMLPRIKSLVASLGIAKDFEFPGFINSNQVHDLLAISDVYVMPSVSEPFGIAALEAINANVPVILSKKCGLAELVESVYKIDAWDCDAIADAIAQLIENPIEARNFASNAKDELQKTTWCDSASELKGLYTELLEEIYQT